MPEAHMLLEELRKEGRDNRFAFMELCKTQILHGELNVDNMQHLVVLQNFLNYLE